MLSYVVLSAHLLPHVATFCPPFAVKEWRHFCGDPVSPDPVWKLRYLLDSEYVRFATTPSIPAGRKRVWSRRVSSRYRYLPSPYTAFCFTHVFSPIHSTLPGAVFPDMLLYVVLCAHLLPHVAICRHVSLTFSRES